MDDDDEYLYGESLQDDPKPVAPDYSNNTNFDINFLDSVREPEPNPIPVSKGLIASYGLIDHLEDEAENLNKNAASKNGGQHDQNNQDEEDEEEEEADFNEESDDDVEIIMEPVNRSLDFRNQGRQQTGRTGASSLPPNLPTAPRAAGLSLTTEYTPISRGGPPQSSSVPSQRDSVVREPDDGIDTSTLPPATAPPSAPTIDPNAVGIFDGRSVLEVDLSAMTDKPWRRPGSDISDWFNYGFDELSWEAYCHRRRELGELANVLKANVINFAAMPEDQLLALPPEVRTMVMTGASSMMNNAANSAMMPPGVMMDMSGMMGAMGAMGMNSDMAAMGGSMMQNMMPPDGNTQGGQQAVVGPGGAGAAPDQVAMLQDPGAFNTTSGPGMMHMGIGDFVMQEQNPMVQQIYPVMESQNVQTGTPSGRGTSIPFRGRGAPPGGLGRGGRGFAPRGRGRGGIYGTDAPQSAPVRPASPLPPNVPTGPRNQNKYKDRDGNAPAVDGLDYGGGKDAMGRRTPSGEPEERMSSRKRRSSPGLDDIRGSKRR